MIGTLFTNAKNAVMTKYRRSKVAKVDKKEEVKKEENIHAMKPLELDWSHKEPVKFSWELGKKKK
jgi:hypothetical protein